MDRNMTNEEIFEGLLEILEKYDLINWTVVVSELGFEGNWMNVRGILQYMINEKIIVRTKNVSEEIYLKVV